MCECVNIVNICGEAGENGGENGQEEGDRGIDWLGRLVHAHNSRDLSTLRRCQSAT